MNRLVGDLISVTAHGNQVAASADVEKRLRALLWFEVLPEGPISHPGHKASAFVLMPNHVHAVVRLVGHEDGQVLSGDARRRSRSLGSFVAFYKSKATRAARDAGVDLPIWQRGFHDRILWTDHSVAAAETYVERNPAVWPEDPLRRSA